MSTGREFVERAWGRVLGADPGLVRLRSAGRTTVALGAAAEGLTAGLLLAPHRLAGDVGLVLVSAGALPVRRFGPRAALLGTAALLAYFAAVLLGSPVAELPWPVVSVVAGTAISHLVLGRLLPDHPGALQARTLAAFQVRLGGVADAVADAVRAGRPGARQLGRVRASTARLRETALAVHDRLSRGRPVGTGDGSEDPVLLGVLDAELAGERPRRPRTAPVRPLLAAGRGHAGGC